ncbi:mRNA turnover protein [Gracilaria domingensis]|nr:mRNA turnover protein [Gracilaria domingensis]
MGSTGGRAVKQCGDEACHSTAIGRRRRVPGGGGEKFSKNNGEHARTLVGCGFWQVAYVAVQRPRRKHSKAGAGAAEVHRRQAAASCSAVQPTLTKPVEPLFRTVFTASSRLLHSSISEFGCFLSAAMGRSKRERVVALTKTRKHVIGKKKKQELLEAIRSDIDQYEHIYVFSTDNMRNAKLKQLRSSWNDSTFFFGRKKIAQIALGRSPEEEYADGLRELSKQLVGNVGLLFTNRDHAKVLKFFSSYCEDEFARSGFVATEQVHLNAGPLERFAPSQEQNLRQIELPVGLKKGVITLLQDFTVCNKGDVLTPERAKVLELLDIRMAKFRLRLLCHYRKSDASFEQLVQ